MHKKLKVLYIVTSLTSGGAEAMIYKLAKHMPKEDVDLSIITLRFGGFYEEKLLEYGIVVEDMGFKKNPFSILPLYRLLNSVRRLKPDVIHTWLYHADFIGGIMVKLSQWNAKLIWSIRGEEVSLKANKLQTYLFIRGCGLLSKVVPDSIVSNSSKGTESHIGIGYPRKKIAFIPNGFEVNRPTTPGLGIREEVSLIAEGEFVIAHIGRLDYQKNQRDFVRVAEIISKLMSNVRFIMVGNGVTNDCEWLQQLVVDCSLTSKLTLLGERRDIPDILSQVDIVVSTSLGEAFPNVVGEAIMAEVPCIVTDVGDCRKIVGDDSMCFDIGNVEGIARRAVQILNMDKSEKVRFIKQISTGFKSKYSIENVAQQFIDCYREIVL